MCLCVWWWVYLKTLEGYVEVIGEEIWKIERNISPTINMSTHDALLPQYQVTKKIANSNQQVQLSASCLFCVVDG